MDIVRLLEHWATNVPNEAFEGVLLADVIKQAAAEITRLRSLAGAVSDGHSAQEMRALLTTTTGPVQGWRAVWGPTLHRVGEGDVGVE